MSDTPTADVNASGGGAGPEPAKAPARPVAEVRADIERERAGLERSFADLRDELDEAVDAGKQRAARVGRRAAVVVPAAVTALAVALVVRGRRRAAR